LFFKPPESFSYWLADRYGVENAEDLGDLELLYIFVCSFVTILSIALVAMAANRILKKGSKDCQSHVNSEGAKVMSG